MSIRTTADRFNTLITSLEGNQEGTKSLRVNDNSKKRKSINLLCNNSALSLDNQVSSQQPLTGTIIPTPKVNRHNPNNDVGVKEVPLGVSTGPSS